MKKISIFIEKDNLKGEKNGCYMMVYSLTIKLI